MRPRARQPDIILSPAQQADLAAYTVRSNVFSAEGPRAADMSAHWGGSLIDERWRGRPNVRRYVGPGNRDSSPGTFRGMAGFGLGDTEEEDIVNAGPYRKGASGCGCHSGLAGGVEGMIKAHPIAMVLGAFLLGYLIKKDAKGLF